MARRIDLTPGFCILWSLLLLVLPLRLLLAAATAAILHEVGHALAIRLLGGAILSLKVGAGGMEMETMPMEPWRELVCALAGPAASLTLVGFHAWFPGLALCGFCQGCFNLLPLYPLDGGRAAACVLTMAGLEKLMKPMEFFVLAALLLLALTSGLGVGPVAVWGMLALRKIPCKAGRFAVQ